MLFGRFRLHTDQGQMHVIPTEPAEVLNDPIQLMGILYTHNVADTSTLFLRRRCFELTGGFDVGLKRLQDWDFVLRLICEHKVSHAFCDDILVDNYWQSNSISLTMDVTSALIQLFVRHVEQCCKNQQLDAAFDAILPHVRQTQYIAEFADSLPDSNCRSIIRQSLKQHEQLRQQHEQLRQECNKIYKQNKVKYYGKYYIYKCLSALFVRLSPKLVARRDKYHDIVRRIRLS